MANHSNHFTEDELINTLKPNKYQKGKIYAIRSHQTDKIYIGSTCNSLSKRLYCHRSQFKMSKNVKNYVTSFEIIEFPDHYIELIESFPCNNKMELEKREGEIMRNFYNKVNKNMPGNNLSIEEYSKQYREINKNKCNKASKEWKISNKEHVKKYTKDYCKEYYKKNLKTIICECGMSYNNFSKSKHIKTSYHIISLSQKNKQNSDIIV